MDRSFTSRLIVLACVAASTASAQRGFGGAQAGPNILSGKIVMADESPVPDSVRIVRVCSGKPLVVTTADRKGRFSFQWGPRQGLLTPDIMDTDSAAPGGMRNVPAREGGSLGIPSDDLTGSVSASAPSGISMAGCALRADLKGYSSSSVNLGGRVPTDETDVGTIVLTRLTGMEESSKAPADARKAYEHGLDSIRKGKTADAQKDFEKAVSIYPQYASAWLNLAKIRLQNKQTDDAREAFQKAVDADDKLMEARVQLGQLAANDHQWADAAKQFDAVLKMDPAGFPQVWFPDAVANFNLKNFDAAEKSAREALKLEPVHGHPEVDRLLGLVLASKGKFDEALNELNIYLKFAPEGPDSEAVRGQVAQIEKMQSQVPPRPQ